MPAPQINFHYMVPVNNFRDRARLKTFLGRLLASKGKARARVQYIFCSDTYLLRINKEFLHHHDLTDIISFNLAPTGQAIDGEIYISVGRVRENAAVYGSNFKGELHRVIFHGALHLCGYGDKTLTEKKTMRAMEDRCLARYFR
jgi:probable rRNA maturation factor